MNRNPDGTELTTEQLLAFAETTGCDMEKLRGEISEVHNANASRSLLLFATREARFEAFTRGELILRTQLWERPNNTPAVNPEIFEFLTATTKGAVVL